MDVTGGLPWAEYSKDRLRSGVSYPVTRSVVERALREADAAVGSLAFIVPTPGHPRVGEGLNIVEVFWFGRARVRQLVNGSLPPADALFMRVWAVDSARRQDIANLLETALPEACRWIAGALAREPGSVWSAANHELIVRYQDSAVEIHEN
jgi:hypothetical protein